MSSVQVKTGAIYSNEDVQIYLQVSDILVQVTPCGLTFLIVLLDKRIYLYSGMKKRFPCISLSAGVGLALLLKGKEIIKWSLHLMGSPRGVYFHDTIYERPPFFFYSRLDKWIIQYHLLILSFIPLLLNKSFI